MLFFQMLKLFFYQTSFSDKKFIVDQLEEIFGKKQSRR